MPPTYPGSPALTVDVLLKQPRVISRELTSLVSKRFIADRMFARGTSEQVAGGAAIFQRSESIYTDRDVEEVMPRAEYPRASWTEELFTATVHKYGLEVPISDEARRRNAMDEFARATRKLANAVVKYVDTKAIALITADTDVQTLSASGDWSTAATDIVFDIATAKQMVDDMEEGYEADTLVVNSAQQLDLIVDKDIRDALLQGGSNVQSSILTGQAAPILGLRQILVTKQLAAGTALVLSSNILGTIADEAPDPQENYQVFNPGNGMAPVYTKVYRNDNRDESIVRGARFPAMWIAEPKSAVKITGA